MNDHLRPDPDALLAAARKAEAEGSQGRLKVFLGMCPGVGKTYAMLLAAQQRQEEGVDVVIGYIETHGRIETQALTAGLARLPRRVIEHRGVRLEEMDVDAILKRRPALVLVDELAHSNVAGGRHIKRYQDVLELLEEGIDVYTTLNVQHVESYRDVVTQITGAPVHENVPDILLDRADEIELIDISAEQLRKRLDEGKVYLGDRAVAASESFFREGNLKALREIALRVTAERADRELREFMRSRSISGPWKSRERFLVAVGPSPYSGHLIRWTRRVATLTHGTWTAVYIDTGRPLEEGEKTRLEKNLSVARTLGAEVITATGSDVTETLIRVAREQNASQIVVGKPLSHLWIDLFRGGSLVDKLIRRSGDIDVYVVRAEKTAPSWRPDFASLAGGKMLVEFGQAILMVILSTVLGLLVLPYVGYMAVGLLYLLGVLVGSVFLSRWPTLLAGTLTAVAWNFLFITPTFTFFISSAHDVILFGMYFVVALVMGHINTRMRQREYAERKREEQATALYHFSRDVGSSASLGDALREGVRHIDTLFKVQASVLVGPQLSLVAGFGVNERELAVARWAFEKNEGAGKFTDTLPQAGGTYIPLRAGENVTGILGLRSDSILTLSEKQLLETFATQIALLIERDRFMREAEAAKLEEKSRRLQKTLLDSVSHEFKTPLAVIATATENLAGRSPNDVLVGEIRIASERLQRIVANLLDITRIETGAVLPKASWCDLREIIERARQQQADVLSARTLRLDIAEKAEACLADPGLLEEIVGNLLRNAAQQSPPGSVISVVGRSESDGLALRVIDQGPGISAEEAGRIFEKFQRGQNAQSGGLGLGLSIVRGFVEAHGGEVKAVPRAERGSGGEIRIFLPVATRSMASITAA